MKLISAIVCSLFLLGSAPVIAESTAQTIVIEGRTYYLHGDGIYRLTRPTSDLESAPQASPSSGVPNAPEPLEGRTADESRLPYFRYLLNQDTWREGRCGAADIDLRASNITPPKGICKVALTAAHCLRDGIGDAMGQLLLENTPGACKGRNAAGVSAQLKLSHNGSAYPVYITVMNHDLTRESGPDIGLILVPCNSELTLPNSSRLAESIPVTHGQYRVYLTRWYPGRQFNVSPYTEAFDHHAITFNPPNNITSRPGDSGSPFFYYNPTQRRWELAGALSGATERGRIIMATNSPNMTHSNRNRWSSRPRDLVVRMLNEMSCSADKLEDLIDK